MCVHFLIEQQERVQREYRKMRKASKKRDEASRNFQTLCELIASQAEAV